jgi:hypothetical protein
MADQTPAWARAGQFLFNWNRAEVLEEASPTGPRTIHIPTGAYTFHIQLLRHPGETLLPSRIFPTARACRQSENCYKAMNALRAALGPEYVKQYIDTQKGDGYALKGPIAFLDDRRNVIGRWPPVPPIITVNTLPGSDSSPDDGSEKALHQNQAHPSSESGRGIEGAESKAGVVKHSRLLKRWPRWIRVASPSVIAVLLVSFCALSVFFVAPSIPPSHEVAEDKPTFRGVVWDEPPRDAIVYVANIDGPGNNRYRVTDVLLSELNRLTKEHPEIRIFPLGRAISQQENISGLMRGLRQRQVTLLVWGQYALTSKRVYLDLRFELPLPWTAGLDTREQMTQLRPLGEMETFQVTLDLAKDVRSRILLTEGLLYLARGEFGNSERILHEAANVSSKGTNRNAICLLLAKTQLLQHREEAALQTLRVVASSRQLTIEEKLDLLTTRAQTYAAMKNFDVALPDISAAIAEGQQYQKDRGCGSQELACRLFALALLQRVGAHQETRFFERAPVCAELAARE